MPIVYMSNEKALHLNYYNSAKHCQIKSFATFKNVIAAHKDENTISLYKYIINSYIKILPVTNNLPLSVTEVLYLIGSAHLTFTNCLYHHGHKF